MGDMLDTPFLMEAVSFIYAEYGEPLVTARLWGFAEAFRENTHSIIPPAYIQDYEGPLQDIRATCGEADFEAAWQAGRTLTWEQAVALANQLLIHAQTPAIQAKAGSQDADRTPEPITRYELTPREVEVLRLVAKGLSDAEVAEQLVISPRTVSKHLQSIYSKIDVNSRSAATRFAIEEQLT